MNVLKRAKISMSRRPVKSSCFLFIIFLLSVLTAGAIFAYQAMMNTDHNLRLRMPTIVTVVHDFSSSTQVEQASENERKMLTPEMIREIGTFPEVRSFDYSIELSWGVTAPGVRPWDNPDFLFTPSFDYEEDLGVRLRISGVNHSDFLEVRDGLVHLVSGRSFLETEMMSLRAPYPALIASGFAQTNGLTVGSIIEAQISFSIGEAEGAPENRIVEVFPIEIVGLLEPIMTPALENADVDALFQADRQQALMQHRVYVPNAVAESMFQARAEGDAEPDEVFLHNFFMLKDPMDFNHFVSKVEYLPGVWQVIDLSSGFQSIAASMESMRDVATLIFLIAIGATLLIVSLLTLFLLYERKHEIGVYLALGESKGKIMLQMFLEVIPLAIVGMTLALFVGHFFANALSQELLRQDLVNERMSGEPQPFNPLEELGYHFSLSQDEMLESYEMGLDLHAILLFYSIGLATFLMAILVPIQRVTKLDPKKLLM